MAHPMAGQAKASVKRRLGYLKATAGKSWGSSQMYKKTSYPKKQAGTQRELTISGGKGKRRADRFAGGGAVGKKHKPHHTTNIVIAAPGGSGGHALGGRGVARPPRIGAPTVVRPPIAPAMAPRPPIAPPIAARPPVAAAPPVPPVGAAPLGGGMGSPPVPPRPVLPAAPVRPPLPGMKTGGAVRKKNGGSTGRAYPGFPHSPTSGDADAVSAHKAGGGVGKYRFGGLKKN